MFFVSAFSRTYSLYTKHCMYQRSWLILSNCCKRMFSTLHRTPADIAWWQSAFELSAQKPDCDVTLCRMQNALLWQCHQVSVTSVSVSSFLFSHLCPNILHIIVIQSSAYPDYNTCTCNNFTPVFRYIYIYTNVDVISCR